MILAPYLTIPLLITSIVFGLIYLMAEYKPMTVESDINKVLSASVKKLSNKKMDAKFESQAVPWSTAFKFWLTGTLTHHRQKGKAAELLTYYREADHFHGKMTIPKHTIAAIKLKWFGYIKIPI